MKHPTIATLLLMCLIVAPLAAEEKTENYPDGGKHLVYSVNEKGEKNGMYREYHPNGKLKVQAGYREGELAGAYKEYDEKGRPTVTATYRAGKLNGVRQVSIDGHLTNDEFWLEGKLIVPKSAALLTAQFRAIQSLKIKTVGEIPPEASAAVKAAVNDKQLQTQREAGLRVLMACRCVCGLPYADIALDREYTAHAEAASTMLLRVGKLDHTPANPGLPEAEYKFGFKGTSSSNLDSSPSPVASMKAYMADSQQANIDRVGHRRWCLNPSMGKTGFGCGGKLGVMWCMDTSRTEVPDYDFVAWPTQGITPLPCVSDKLPWSASLNPAKYKEPVEKDVKVKIVPARFLPKQGTLEKLPGSLKIDYFTVNNANFGIPYCIIFRPTGVKIAPGSSYWVEISGLKTKSGEDAVVEYLVSFATL